MDGIFLIFIVITFVFFIRQSYGYAHCWDGDNGGMYYGTLAITTSGLHCQPWSAQSPHTHSDYDEDADFPFDGTVGAANNYCRDPDFNFVPWCYTMDPFERWEACDVPICPNLPCGFGIEVGASDPSTLSTNIDSNTGINYLALDAAYTVACCGSIERWKLYIKRAGTVKMQVWRQDSATGEYVLRGENTYTYSVAQENAVHEHTVSLADLIPVRAGDKIGWYTSTDMISYDNGVAMNNLLLSTTTPSVGQSVSFSAATTRDTRDYAVGVDVGQNFAPYFTNSDTTASISFSTPVGTPVFGLSATDDDVGHVADLEVTMTTVSTYFELNPATREVQVKNTLDIGVYDLHFEVLDDCREFGIFTLTITVYDEPVAINNLPNFGNVSESETGETLTFTLAFDSAGPHSCNIDSYSPNRTEGNPFLVKATPSSDVGVYLKAGAAVRYSVSTSYDVTLTCTDGSTSDTRVLTVNILPNSAPVFQSWISAKTLSAPSTPNGFLVLQATITDAESDPLTIAMPTCTPTPCPFAVNNDGNITTTEDFEFHNVSSYTIQLSAYDGYNTVTSPTVTITISDLNEKPVLTNMGGTRNVLENTAIGATVFTVLQYDGNGDPPDFSATYAPPVCATLFALNNTDGSITTLASLDYETVAETSCVLTVTVNDDKVDSDPGTITLEVIDINEPPVFSSASYAISTPEVTAGTVLPDPGITATDPEGTAVTLSLDCGVVDSGYLSINPSTGIVTMVTEYELDPALASYTMNCTVTATDTASQTSTAPLTVEVTDANDNMPIFTAATYTINILSTQALGVIGSVTVNDNDSTSPNNLITLTQSASAEFLIDGSGNVQLVGDVTGVTGITPFTVTVTATDGGGLFSTATVQVLVSDAATASTTTTTTTTTTGSTGGGGTSDSGFFSSILNIILFALAIALGTFALVAGCYVLYRLCRSKPHASGHMPRYNEKQNNIIEETPERKKSNTEAVRKRSLSDSFKRPVSNDSGINISMRTPPPANTRFQPISVQPAGDAFTADSTDAMTSPRSNNLTMHDIREWKLYQGQWRQALLAGRLKH